MISIRSGVFVAVNRPPGCGSISAIPPTGLFGSGLGLLGLTEATSKAAGGVAAGVCANAGVAASRVASANAHVERIMFNNLSSRMANAAERPGRQDRRHQGQQYR